MGFCTGAKAKIWEVKKADRYTDVRLSISKKNDSGGYEAEFSGYVRLVGKAHEADVQENDTVKIGRCDVKNKYDKEAKKLYTNFVIFSFQGDEEEQDQYSRTEAPERKATISEMQPIPEDLPF